MDSREQKLRCFVAIDFPEEIKTALAQARAALQKWPVRVKWVEPANYHLTLKFLGDIPASVLPQLTAALERAAAGQNPFSLRLQGLGAFPRLNRPRVIWAGIRDESGGLQVLHKAVESALGELGFPGDKDPFSPHLTLGRVKESVPAGAAPAAADLAGFAREVRIDTAPAAVTEIILMRSVLDRSGPTYSRLARCQLGK